MTMYSCSNVSKKEVSLPLNCLQECPVKYSDIISPKDADVTAYSNCQSSCVVWDPHHEHTLKHGDVYTGIKWQCVEYARRWLLLNNGVVFGSIDYAYEIWDKVTHYHTPDQKKSFIVKNHKNGQSSTLPRYGDLFIYSKEHEQTGHVAVVLDIDLENKKIKLGEQNFSNSIWPGNYAREVSFKLLSNKVLVDDNHLIGWKRVELHTEE